MTLASPTRYEEPGGESVRFKQSRASRSRACQGSLVPRVRQSLEGHKDRAVTKPARNKRKRRKGADPDDVRWYDVIPRSTAPRSVPYAMADRRLPDDRIPVADDRGCDDEWVPMPPPGEYSDPSDGFADDRRERDLGRGRPRRLVLAILASRRAGLLQFPFVRAGSLISPTSQRGQSP